MKKIALIVGLLISVGLYSQSDYRKGFIINNSGKKIIGYVNYKENRSVYDYCEFKSSLDGSVSKYTPELISGYGFENDKRFTSKSIEKNNSTAKKFLEIIISGEATLLKLNRTFYIKVRNNFKELNNEVIEYTRGAKVFRRPSKKYLGVLKILLKDCIEVKNKVDKTNYGEKKLVKLLDEYNKCKGQKSIVYKMSKPWFNIKFGLATGISHSNLKYTFDAYDKIYFTDKSNSNISLTFGGYIELSSPRTSERFSFYAGVFFNNNTFVTNMKTLEGDIPYIGEVITDLKQIKIPLGLRYTFPKKTFTPFLTLGLTNYSNINSSTRWSREREAHNTVYISQKKFITENFNLGYFGSIGVKKRISKKLNAFIDLIYEKSMLNNSTAPNATIPTDIEKRQYSMSNLQLLIGIQF